MVTFCFNKYNKLVLDCIMVVRINKKRIVLLVLLVQSMVYSQDNKVLLSIKNQESAVGFFTISGHIKESKSNIVIANADLYLLNCNKSVVANADGAFQFNIPKNSFNDKLVISALGYYSDTILVSKLEKLKNESLQIKLNKEVAAEVAFSEMIISSSKSKSKGLSAETIIKKARENIKNNYYQKPFNQKFFFRAQTSSEGVYSINEGASVNTYSPNGIQVSDDAASNYFGEILQFKGKSDEASKENWKGIGYFGVVIFRNILLSNQNVLYETSSYELNKEKTVEYAGKKVYVIRFINPAPDVFSTGFGNPPPNSVSGFIYIDAVSFAVVKFEQYVILKPARSNDNDDISVDSTLKMIQTYKCIDGQYFINYCNEKVESEYFSVSENKKINITNSNYDLMSADINKESVSPIIRPIDRLKLDVKVEEDPEYWKNNNFILENEKNDL
jgi:hypothetical protein